MTHGSRLKAHGSWLKAHGPWLMVKGPAGQGLGPLTWPWPMSLEPWALSLEPWQNYCHKMASYWYTWLYYNNFANSVENYCIIAHHYFLGFSLGSQKVISRIRISDSNHRLRFDSVWHVQSWNWPGLGPGPVALDHHNHPWGKWQKACKRLLVIFGSCLWTSV